VKPVIALIADGSPNPNSNVKLSITTVSQPQPAPSRSAADLAGLVTYNTRLSVAAAAAKLTAWSPQP